MSRCSTSVLRSREYSQASLTCAAKRGGLNQIDVVCDALRMMEICDPRILSKIAIYALAIVFTLMVSDNSFAQPYSWSVGDAPTGSGSVTGNPTYPLTVAPGDTLSFSGNASDTDTRTAGSMADYPYDTAVVVWSADYGSFDYARASSGQTVTWTAPQLSGSQTTLTCTIYIAFDDASTSSPGAIAPGDTGNRDDNSAPNPPMQVVQVQVKLCKITGITNAPNESAVPCGTEAQATAAGDNLDNINWWLSTNGRLNPTSVGKGATADYPINVGVYKLRASCGKDPNANFTSAPTLTQVGIAWIQPAGLNVGANDTIPQSLTVSVGDTVNLTTIPLPLTVRAYPIDNPTWRFTSVPNGSTVTATAEDQANLQFVPDVAGMYTVQARYGTSSATFTVTAGGALLSQTILIPFRDPVVSSPGDFDPSGGGGGGPPYNLPSIVAWVKATVRVDTSVNNAPVNVSIAGGTAGGFSGNYNTITVGSGPTAMGTYRISGDLL